MTRLFVVIFISSLMKRKRLCIVALKDGNYGP